ncbi:hypothetical protein GWI33_013687 [Rhynchophorus ferrugineus]|uniref:Uncharacterized protein n=1 Tax=Rhynchophorus ferrugineus TaxID=354439 RepID=A0A834I453_RHYFE|nr:hypothetical protein GWI33_013687 [Rhynchophorus ferrugineus]
MRRAANGWAPYASIDPSSMAVVAAHPGAIVGVSTAVAVVVFFPRCLRVSGDPAGKPSRKMNPLKIAPSSRASGGLFRASGCLVLRPREFPSSGVHHHDPGEATVGFVTDN